MTPEEIQELKRKVREETIEECARIAQTCEAYYAEIEILKLKSPPLVVPFELKKLGEKE